MSFSKKIEPQRDAQYIDFLIKNDKLLPYHKGKLQRSITTEVKSYYKTKEIKVYLSGEKVKYAGFLENGTRPHDIPHAFGYGTVKPPKKNPYTHEEPFGVGGRFYGFFHPGSIKHKGFVEYVMLNNCLNYLTNAYDVIKIVSGSKLW